MIFFVDNNGKIINSQPETVYQGAADTNNIYLVAPFAADLSFAVAFTLPNGVHTERYFMTNGMQLEDVEYPKTGNRFALWRLAIPNNVTQHYGTVYAQFYTYATNGAITPTSRTSFVVSQGIPEELPDTPTQDIYNQILTVLSQIQSQVGNGTYAARAIYWWIDTYVYGMNEITFYPIGEYGAFVRSIVTENEGNEPYDEEGTLNSEYWQELVNFNEIIQALADAKTAAEEAAKSEENAAASATAAASSAEAAAKSEANAKASEKNAAASAEAAAGSAEEAAQSAAAAAQSEANAAISESNAAQSAEEAAQSAEILVDRLNRTSKFVTELPEVGDDSYIYFVAAEGGGNIFNIWVYENDDWAQLGSATLVISNTSSYPRTLAADGWEDNRQTVTINGLSTEDHAEVEIEEGYSSAYITNGIRVVSVIENGILFECETVPEEDIAIGIDVIKEQNVPTAEGYYTIGQADNQFAAGATIEVDPETYVITLTLTAKDGTEIAKSEIDLPLETVVVNGSYDSESQCIILTLQNNNTVSVPVSDLVAGLATQAELATETAERQAADTALGERIDDIESGDTIVGKSKEAELAAKATMASYATAAGKVKNDLQIFVNGEETTYNGSEVKQVIIDTQNITDSEAVHFTKQTLTDGQKAQARANIGAPRIIPAQITIEATEWSADEHTAVMTVEGITNESIISVSPHDGHGQVVIECGIHATAQGENTVTFTCETVPEGAVIMDLTAVNLSTEVDDEDEAAESVPAEKMEPVEVDSIPAEKMEPVEVAGSEDDEEEGDEGEEVEDETESVPAEKMTPIEVTEAEEEEAPETDGDETEITN